VIIDSHVYCFSPADSPAGHENAKEHLNWLQVSVAGHHQRAMRLSDRSPNDASTLAPNGLRDVFGPPDVLFRPDNERGRLVWTVDGKDYTKYWMPPNLRNLEFTLHSLIAEMDYAGVEMALLHTDPTLGRDSAFLAECVKAYPDRLRAMAPVDEWRLVDELDTVVEELTAAVETHGLHAIKFIPDLAYLRSSEPWDDGTYRPFWEVVASLNVPIFFTLGTNRPGKATTSDHLEGYLEQLGILMRWMDRYPDTPVGLTHGFPYRLIRDGDRIVIPETFWQPFANLNCHLEVCLPVRLGDWFDYPYRELWPVVEEMVDRVGPQQLIWGTDMPFQNRFCTYRQSRTWIEKYCTFLDSDSKSAIMGDTISRLLGLERFREDGT
jgi:predicted TIM-barrel fold metal-dependent hydrolase